MSGVRMLYFLKDRWKFMANPPTLYYGSPVNDNTSCARQKDVNACAGQKKLTM